MNKGNGKKANNYSQINIISEPKWQNKIESFLEKNNIFELFSFNNKKKKSKENKKMNNSINYDIKSENKDLELNLS